MKYLHVERGRLFVLNIVHNKPLREVGRKCNMLLYIFTGSKGVGHNGFGVQE